MKPNHERIFLPAIYVACFLVLYLTINYFTSLRTVHTLSTVIDQQIPFLAIFIIPYISTYLLVLLPYMLIKRIDTLRKLTIAYFIALAVASIIYLVYPAYVQRPVISSAGFFDKIVLWYYSIDLPHNSFPSLHVANAVLSSIALMKLKNGKYFLIWLAAVILSVLFVKQHYILDVLAGIGLSLLIYFSSKPFFKEYKP